MKELLIEFAPGCQKFSKVLHTVNFEFKITCNRALTSENLRKAKRAQEMKQACEVSTGNVKETH